MPKLSPGDTIALVAVLITVGTGWLGWSVKTGLTEPLSALRNAIDELRDTMKEMREDTQSKLAIHDIELAHHDDAIKTLQEKLKEVD